MDPMLPRALAALLSYPTQDLLDAIPDILSVLEAQAPLVRALPALRRHCAWLATTDLLDAQESYVGTFDRIRSVSLHLFEHVHGDGRERGPAMVELSDIYAKAGLAPTSSELPDYLPMLLEFSAIDPAQGVALLTNAAPVIDLLHGRLVSRDSTYAAVLHAVLALCGQRPSAEPVPAEPEETPEALDKAWEEAAVLFGPGSDPDSECASGRSWAAARTPQPPSHRPVVRHVAASFQG